MFSCCVLNVVVYLNKQMDMVSVQQYCHLVPLCIVVNDLFGVSGLECATVSPCPVYVTVSAVLHGIDVLTQTEGQANQGLTLKTKDKNTNMFLGCSQQGLDDSN